MPSTSPSNLHTAIVFLDIDDVLCLNAPYGGYAVILAMSGRHANPTDVYERVFAARTRRVLKDVHEQMKGQVRYVISSTWRDYLDRKQLVDVFNVTSMGFVADALYEGERWCTPPSRKDSTRAEDVAKWLKQHHAGEPFVILDDTLSGASLALALDNPLHCLTGRVLLCEEFEGLLDRHVPFIVSALQSPVKSDGEML